MGAIRLRNMDNIKNLLEVQSPWIVLLSLSMNRHTTIVFGLIAPSIPHSINRAIVLQVISTIMSFFFCARLNRALYSWQLHRLPDGFCFLVVSGVCQTPPLSSFMRDIIPLYFAKEAFHQTLFCLFPCIYQKKAVTLHPNSYMCENSKQSI